MYYLGRILTLPYVSSLRLLLLTSRLHITLYLLNVWYHRLVISERLDWHIFVLVVLFPRELLFLRLLYIWFGFLLL